MGRCPKGWCFMIIKVSFPSNKLQEFKIWESKWKNVVKIRKRPTDLDSLPSKITRKLREPLLFVEVEFLDLSIESSKWPIHARLMIDELLDLSGFYHLDKIHPTSMSFSFEKDIEPAFEIAFGKDLQTRLAEIEIRLSADCSNLRQVILASADDRSREELLSRSREIIRALLEIIEAVPIH